jgi:uncharacterized membrane protein (GlpM family)
LAGLLAVMPLTGVIVMLWLHSDRPEDFYLMREYTRAALWGILPSIAFFLTAFVCFNRKMQLWAVLCISFSVWAASAATHQVILAWLSPVKQTESTEEDTSNGKTNETRFSKDGGIDGDISMAGTDGDSTTEPQ